MEMTRGIRNNNPGNIRKTDVYWQMERTVANFDLGVYTQDHDDAFEMFVLPEFGIRAMVRILNTYVNEYGLDTVEEILGRWAPVEENHTTKYIRFVEQRTGLTKVPWRFGDIALLTWSIIQFENALYQYPLHTLVCGVALSGLFRPEELPFIQVGDKYEDLFSLPYGPSNPEV